MGIILFLSFVKTRKKCYNLISKSNWEGFNMNDILVAIIGGISVAVPSVVATVLSNKRNNDLVLYRINELDNKVHEHNNLIDRMYKVENRVTLLEDNKKDAK